MEGIDEVTIIFVPRNENRYADALANLAAVLTNSENKINSFLVCKRWAIPLLPHMLDLLESNNVSVVEEEKEDWRQPLIDFLNYGKLPEDPRHKSKIRRRAPRFIHYKDTLYRRSFDGVFLGCVGEDEVSQIIEEAHSEICGAHQSGPKLHFWIKRMRYFWPTMVKDCMNYARKCEVCQFHANFIHQPPKPLHPTIASWPFDVWGLDVIDPITPKSSGRHA